MVALGSDWMTGEGCFLCQIFFAWPVPFALAVHFPLHPVNWRSGWVDGWICWPMVAAEPLSLASVPLAEAAASLNGAPKDAATPDVQRCLAMRPTIWRYHEPWRGSD